MSETFQFLAAVWDVDKALEIVGDRPPDGHVRTEQVVSYLNLIRIDREYAMSDAVDLSKPLILVPVEGACLVIDGWHRLYRARQEGIEELSAWVLTKEEEKQVRIS